MSRAVSVFILSDNRLFRESLGRILAKRADVKIASSQGSSAKACEEALRSSADVILLDSLEFLCSNAAGLGTREKPRKGMRVLLVAMEEDEQVFLRAIRAGAMGFVPKDASALDLVSAVRSVARGEAVCPPRFCKFLFDCVAQVKEPSETEAKPNFVLTRRERQLVPMIGEGLTNKEIAQQLNLSEQTIKNHVHRILHKIGVDSRMSIFTAIHQLPN